MKLSNKKAARSADLFLTCTRHREAEIRKAWNLLWTLLWEGVLGNSLVEGKHSLASAPKDKQKRRTKKRNEKEKERKRAEKEREKKRGERRKEGDSSFFLKKQDVREPPTHFLFQKSPTNHV